MTVAVFAGPSISHEEAGGILKAQYLPPAKRGDVYRAIRRGATTIGVIDGYFETVPSLMHKEILWALIEGVSVFGASSIGALRAAELADFGMVGVGGIFHDYRDGRIVADDEVAVSVGPAELGFPALSDPLVNIRATIEAAVLSGVICQSAAANVLAIAGAMFFKERTYRTVFEKCCTQGIDIGAFAAWLPLGKVDRKKADAKEVLRYIKRHIGSGSLAKKPVFEFIETSDWLDLKAMIDQENLPAPFQT